MRLYLPLTALCLFTTVECFAQKEGFYHRSQLAIVSTGGNSRLQTYNGKVENRYLAGKQLYGVSGHYTLGLSEPGEEEGAEEDLVESARNWDAKARFEQEVTRNVRAFTALQYEGDVFSGFTQRTNHDIGGKYIFVETERERLNLEIGYRYTEEHRTEDDEDGRNIFFFNKATIMGELERKRERYNYGVTLQYVPNFTTPEDYQIILEPSFAVVINEAFSMKLAYTGRYDNEPNEEGNERLDWKYTTALVAEF